MPTPLFDFDEAVKLHNSTKADAFFVRRLSFRCYQLFIASMILPTVFSIVPPVTDTVTSAYFS